MSNKKANDEEQVFMQVIQELVDMMNNCIENKTSEEMELTLGDDNMGDAIIVTVEYIKNKNNKKPSKKDMLN